MVHSFIVFCMVLWPKTCQTIEIVPADHAYAQTLEECMQGGMAVSSAAFSYEGADWQTKGVTCREDPGLDLSQLKAEVH
jgi:hypothetical protein